MMMRKDSQRVRLVPATIAGMMIVFMLTLLIAGVVAPEAPVPIHTVLVTLAGLCGVIGVLALAVCRQQQTEAHLQRALTDKTEAEARLADVNRELETSIRQTQGLAAQAHSANHFKSLFLASMSHEIRTPLTSILGFAENLVCMELSESETRTALSAIRRAGEHLLQIINNVLDLSKIEAGKFEIHTAPCSPRATVEEVVALLQTLAEDKGIDVAAAFTEPLPTQVETDPTRLRQILINLVGNAVKFTESGSVRIVVRSEDRDGERARLRFDVVDTGIGMTAQQAARVFQEFEQGDVSKSARFGGTGLGLTISRHLAQLLGGDISFETEPGVGTTFRLVLDVPVLAARADSASSSILGGHTAASTGLGRDALPYRVLLAEDSPDNQRLIAFVLRRAGAKVTVVSNGREAVDVVLAVGDGKAAFDVVLLDMQMPAMDGYDATRLLRGRACPIPVIAITAHAMDDDREKCLQAGCDDFVTKPIHWPTLAQRIRQHAGIKSTGRSRPDGPPVSADASLPAV